MRGNLRSHEVGDFIVETLEPGAQTSTLKDGYSRSVCFDQMVFGTGWDGCGRNIITIVIIKNKDIFVAADGLVEEGAALICEDFSGHFITGGIGVMGAS